MNSDILVNNVYRNAPLVGLGCKRKRKIHEDV